MATSHAAEQVRACKARRTPPRFHASSACARWKKPRPSPCARAPASPNCEPRPRLLPGQRSSARQGTRRCPRRDASQSRRSGRNGRARQGCSTRRIGPCQSRQACCEVRCQTVGPRRMAKTPRAAARQKPPPSRHGGAGVYLAQWVWGRLADPDEPAWRGRLVSVLVHFACSTAFGQEPSFTEGRCRPAIAIHSGCQMLGDSLLLSCMQRL